MIIVFENNNGTQTGGECRHGDRQAANSAQLQGAQTSEPAGGLNKGSLPQVQRNIHESTDLSVALSPAKSVR